MSADRREYYKAYYRAHRAKRIAQSRAWYRRNRERHLENKRRDQQRHGVEIKVARALGIGRRAARELIQKESHP